VSTWIKLHDNFATNLKVLAAGEDAAWLYVCGLLYCSANLTDGIIPTPALRTLTAKKDARTLARILVREGLWVETSQGWEVHEYLLHQRSKEQIVKEREGTRNRVAAYRERKRNGVGNGHVTAPETEAETDNPTPTPPPIGVVTIDDPPEILTTEYAFHGKPSIDPCQVEALRRAREETFGLPDRSAASSSTPVSPIHPPQAQPEGRSE
jgi:hypothetical protein